MVNFYHSTLNQPTAVSMSTLARLDGVNSYLILAKSNMIEVWSYNEDQAFKLSQNLLESKNPGTSSMEVEDDHYADQSDEPLIKISELKLDGKIVFLEKFKMVFFRLFCFSILSTKF